MTLGAYAVDWLRQSSLDLRPATSEFYRHSLRHLDPIADLSIDAVTPAHVRALLETAHRQGKASRTIRGIGQTLRLVLRRAEADGLVERNVAALVRLPKLETKEPQHFTADEARRFLEVARDDELGSLYAVALGTGLRRGELLGLTWRDVDATMGTIHIRRGKTAAAARVVPLPAFARAALTSDAADGSNNGDLGQAGRAGRGSGGSHDPSGVRMVGPIWPYRPEYVSDHFKELCRLAGVPVLTMHSTRHTAATLMAEAGVSEEVRKWVLGHTNVEMTRRYSHENDAAKRDAVERLGRAVG